MSSTNDTNRIFYPSCCPFCTLTTTGHQPNCPQNPLNIKEFNQVEKHIVFSCPSCKMSTSGEHEENCPYNPHNNIDPEKFVKKTGEKNGWICPGCGKVWSPNIESCRECSRPDSKAYVVKEDESFEKNFNKLIF